MAARKRRAEVIAEDVQAFLEEVMALDEATPAARRKAKEEATRVRDTHAALYKAAEELREQITEAEDVADILESTADELLAAGETLEQLDESDDDDE
jgi:hypothetical protein